MMATFRKKLSAPLILLLKISLLMLALMANHSSSRSPSLLASLRV